MKKNLSLACAFFVQATLLSAADTPVTVNWPADAAGNYLLMDVSERPFPKPSTTSGTFSLEDGKNDRLDGPGFDISFTTKEGKVIFSPFVKFNGTTGLRFDQATNTFSFVTTTIQIEKKDCDVNPMLTGTEPNLKGEMATPNDTRTLKLVYGHHMLSYGGLRVGVTIDEHGGISMQDAIAGITLNGSTLSIQGKPFQVATTSKTPWSIKSTDKQRVVGDSPVFLLPGAAVGYCFLQGGNVPFFVNDAGLLSLQAEGPYSEIISFKDKTGVDAATIMVPDGQAKMAARLVQEKSDQALHDKVLSATANAAWKKDFALKDAMNVRDFDEEQLTYLIDLPSDAKPESMKLLGFTDGQVRLVPFQISDDGKSGHTLSFRTDLPRGGSRMFRLVSSFDATGIPATSVTAPTLQAGTDPNEAILGNSLLQVKVPAGHQDFAGGKPLAQVPGPILGLARTAQPQPEMAKSSFDAPDTLKVDSIDAKLIESGPVFATYQIAYKLEDGKSYTVTLELRANEPQVRVAESLEGFTPDDQATLRLNYGKGALDPDQRLAGAGNGYDLFSGDYDRDSKDGKLNYAIGLFTPNGNGLMRSTAFYRGDGSDALLISINRTRDWVTAKRALWSSSGAWENLRFYHVDDRKFMTAGLSGSKRYWVVGLIPRADVVMSIVPGYKQSLGAGPESRLYNQLTLWSLNAYKDRMPDWPEKVDAAPFDTPGFVDFQYYKDYVPLSYDDYRTKFYDSNTYFRDILNFSSNFGGYSDRAVPAFFAEYALSRAKWTPEQRESVRQYLLLLADYVEGDDNQPHHSMLSGHPNFVMDTKQAIPFAVATFPNHPRAKAWRDSYMGFYDEWLDKYERKDVPDLNTKGGRWTENIACYVGQCFVGLTPDQTLLKSYDGTSLAKDPRLQLLLTWMRDSMMAPDNGVRLIPPEGAHSFNFEPDRIGRKVLFKLASEMADDAPQLSQEMKWMETNGKEGKKPDVRSGLFTDYGEVFHYDFGGPHESSAHLSNINGMNYRWSNAGVLYYAAKNRMWSYNTAEANGDEYNINEITAFNVKGRGLGSTPTDQLLYDFDFAQFYRQPGTDDAYLARGVLMVRDDYLAVMDEVKDSTVPGTFNWATSHGVPQIYQLKPGAPVVQKESLNSMHGQAPDPALSAKVFSYSGEGDFLTIVAPDKVTAVATPFGATVNGEYIFSAQAPQDITQDKAVFAGRYGYARENQLALFDGTKIGIDDFTLSKDGGDFGVSAAVDQGKIVGRIVGRSGGKISLVPPTALKAASAKVTINGQSIPSTVEQGAITFSVDIAQKDGLKNYEITF